MDLQSPSRPAIRQAGTLWTSWTRQIRRRQYLTQPLSSAEFSTTNSGCHNFQYIKGWTCDSWARLARSNKHPSFQSNHGSSLYVSRSKSSQGAISWATASRPPRSFGGGLGLLEPDQVRSFCEHGSKEQKILPCDCKKRSISETVKEVSPSANIFEQQWPQETNNNCQQNQYRQNKNSNDMEQEFSNNLATEEII